MTNLMKQLFILACLLLPLTLVGCGDSLPEADFVFINGSDHNTLDPQKISWLHDGRIAESQFEPLLWLDYSTLELRPGVAQRWNVSEDGKTYTFHLRPNARWSNGDPVVADDFVYAWRRALLPDMAADYSQLFFAIDGAKAFFDWRVQQLEAFAQQAGSIDAAQTLWQQAAKRFADTVAIRATDEQTLTVTLAQPVPYFLELCAFTTFLPVHRVSVEQATSLNETTGMLTMDSAYWSDPTRLVTNGPYVLKERKFKQYVLLAANEHYWNRAAMKNRSVLERIITDPQNALLTYQNGGADFHVDVPTASDMAAELVQADRADVHPQAMAGTYFYNFNCLPELPSGEPNPLSDVRVRQALSLAIDRQTLVSRVTRLNQPIADTFVPPAALPRYQPPVSEGFRQNIEKAKQLLADAGYPGGQGLTGLSITYNTGQGHDIIAQAIKNMWQTKLGVVVTLEGLETKNFSDRLKSKNYTIARASWFGDYPDPTTWLQKMATGDGNNDCGWSNAQYDALLAQAQHELDATKRMALLSDAEAILVREQPMALLFHYVSIYLWDPARVQGLTANPWGRWRFEHVQVK